VTDSPRTQRARLTLAAAVRIATGLPHALPRPGQLALLDDMTAAAELGGGQMAGIAPTGSGKSFSALSQAAVGAVDYDERWIISTESIALQSQYVDKDGPVIAAAAKEVLGREVKVEVHKGFSNYTCMLKAKQTAELLGVKMAASESKVINVAERVAKAKLAKTVDIDGFPMDSKRIQGLTAWALAQHTSTEIHGDRGSYSGLNTDHEWSAVSVSTQECLGENSCPLAAVCKPLAARQRTAEADIVITNHSMLAVQASTGTPVIIGSNKLGTFHGIIVDEAHALPSVVRAQGQAQISGRRVNAIAKKVAGVCDDRDLRVQKWMDDGRALTKYVDDEINFAIGEASSATVKIAEDNDPLAQSGDPLTEWLRRGSKFVQAATAKNSDMGLVIRGRRVVSEIDNAVRDVDSVRQHWVGTARWLEPPAKQTAAEKAMRREWASAQSAPVQVSGMINRNLWNEVTKDDHDEELARPLTVATISATLPQGFARDVGLRGATRTYASPFDAAYAESMLFIPRAVDVEDVDALTRPSRYGGKPGFNTQAHASWAAKYMIRLVDANRGSALVLSSTVSAGKIYAEALRQAARGRWNVYSQWDGENIRVLVGRWREDEHSVMVGTRSLMTGVDAPGETNSLVIVDRVPRSASNPVDDARVEMLAEAFDGDKWAADRMVYVSDATLLLEQASGRLIRGMSDSGMVAILDPRMLNSGPFSYQKQVRDAYQKALGRFQAKTAYIADAENFLAARKSKK
jgi:ATP-dependent DNA helicase DinG